MGRLKKYYKNRPTDKKSNWQLMQCSFVKDGNNGVYHLTCSIAKTFYKQHKMYCTAPCSHFCIQLFRKYLPCSSSPIGVFTNHVVKAINRDC